MPFDTPAFPAVCARTLCCTASTSICAGPLHKQTLAPPTPLYTQAFLRRSAHSRHAGERGLRTELLFDMRRSVLSDYLGVIRAPASAQRGVSVAVCKPINCGICKRSQLVLAAGALKKNAKDIDNDLTEEEKQNLVKANALSSTFDCPLSRYCPYQQALRIGHIRQAGLGALAVVAVGIIAFVASKHDKYDCCSLSATQQWC